MASKAGSKVMMPGAAYTNSMTGTLQQCVAIMDGSNRAVSGVRNEDKVAGELSLRRHEQELKYSRV
jgi:hypothetical protein